MEHVVNDDLTKVNYQLVSTYHHLGTLSNKRCRRVPFAHAWHA